MDASRWQKIERLCFAVLERGRSERAAFLREACGGDQSLELEVTALLLGFEKTDSFLERPAMEVEARALARLELQSPSTWRIPDPLIGTTISHYELVEKLGEGGMGKVIKARDTRLSRFVAIKFLRVDAIRTSEQERDLVQEARIASSFHHPNIAHIYGLDQAETSQDSASGPTVCALPELMHFIVMEYVSGATLAEVISAKRIDLSDTMRWAIQISDALATAHKAHIVHGDLKPGNIMIDGDRVAKVLDFGLASLVETKPMADDAKQLVELTTQDVVIRGTPPYMSPEQVEGKKLTERSDIFSFGAVLYEMLSGRRAFLGESALAIMSAVLGKTPSPLSAVRPRLPASIVRIVSRCLQKNPELRYSSGAELHRDLAACQAGRAARETVIGAIIRHRRIVPAVACLIIVCAVAAGLVIGRRSKVNWARTEVLPEISRLIEREEFPRAFRLALKASEYIPNDPELAAVWSKLSFKITVQTTPPGAGVYRKDYETFNAPWEYIGQSPLTEIRIPAGPFARWKFKKEGYEEVERTTASSRFEDGSVPLLSIDLVENGKSPFGMVKVTPRNSPAPLTFPGYEDLPEVRLNDFWIDRYEVTNKQYREFVKFGGYNKTEYWKNEIRTEGGPLSLAAAMKLFRDKTGRPGPAEWVQGEYPEGQDDFPVTGVSWYEAAAYAEFAGKSLPTIYHWDRAATIWTSASMVPASNFQGHGPARAGSFQGMSPYGTYDMAGNAKEWCSNEAGYGKRYILGGAWDEPTYQFSEADARPPCQRDSTFGFRCAKYSSPVPNALNAPVTRSARDYSRERPVSDELFRAYRSFYSYDKTPLIAVTESVENNNVDWKREKVSFSAAYGDERVLAYLFLPKKSKPPFQTVLYFPGSNSLEIRSSADLSPYFLDFILKSGRALMWPVYKGTFERRDKVASDYPNLSSLYRDHVIEWSKDLGRSVDYLETRRDIDQSKLAFFGFSWGGAIGTVLTAVETRLKASVLFMGGFNLQNALPEVDEINFAPHVKQPVLLLSGRYDFAYPVATSQLPMFRLLGTSKENKRHVLYDTAHWIPHDELTKETLQWLDRYLGPVAVKP
jgi:serine/threonine protein kinase/dienelactone hydrolase